MLGAQGARVCACVVSVVAGTGAGNGGAQRAGALPPDRGGSGIATGPVRFWGAEGMVPSHRWERSMQRP